MDTRQQESVPAAKIFSERLALMRGKRTKRAFSKEIGVNSPQTYQHYENGRVPEPDTLKRIADHCGVTVDWLLGREGVSSGKSASSDMATQVALDLDSAEIRTRLTAIERQLDELRAAFVALLAKRN